MVKVAAADLFLLSALLLVWKKQLANELTEPRKKSAAANCIQRIMSQCQLAVFDLSSYRLISVNGL